MEIKLPPNNLYKKNQILSFNKVSALVGENGSGKSSILQSVFMQRLTSESNNKVVCFSSGQNEKFSKLFSDYLAKERQANRGLNLGCCYYDKSWSRLLIFLASISMQGRVREFLCNKKYIDQSVGGLDDLSSQLVANIKVDLPYVNRVKHALKEEELGIKSAFITSGYHRTLESFIHTIVDVDYDFEEPLQTKKIVLNFNNFFEPSFEELPGNYFDEKVTFFTQAADNNYFFDRSTMLLMFNNGIELEDLSDGEYQILFLLALLDLFDSGDTLFLFDEVDSHLHYRNIENLWRELHSIQGMAITTTHLLDSITAPQNTFDSIKVVESGMINEESKVKSIIDRLSNLSRMTSVQFDVFTKLENIVLMDHYNDWLIFLSLAKRKGLDIGKLSHVHVIKANCGYNSINQEFGGKKIEWVKSLLGSNSVRVTKNIFMVCDRDEAAIEFHPDGVTVTGESAKKQLSSIGGFKNTSIYFLSWRRREIKNYLLSYTALSHHGLLGDVNQDLPATEAISYGNPCDYKSIKNLDVKKFVTQIIDTTGLGLDKVKLESYINLIPPEEISDDIRNMYEFIVRKV
jgi:AAA15 family ATPase/GTPase